VVGTPDHVEALASPRAWKVGERAKRVEDREREVDGGFERR
jgi:hypothetical protein